MNDCMDALTNLGRDLDAAGVPSAAAAATVYTYMAALHEQSAAAWQLFYHSMYERLRELAEREYPYAGPAALPLLQLLDDDFGVALISNVERARIRARLVEHGSSEASVPS